MSCNNVNRASVSEIGDSSLCSLFPPPVDLKVWSPERQSRHHPGACWEHTFPGLTSDPLSPVPRGGAQEPGLQPARQGTLMHASQTGLAPCSHLGSSDRCSCSRPGLEAQFSLVWEHPGQE